MQGNERQMIGIAGKTESNWKDGKEARILKNIEQNERHHLRNWKAKEEDS